MINNAEQIDILKITENLTNLNITNKNEVENLQEKLIDTIESCKKITSYLESLSIIAVDLEGIDLGRTGKICIIQITDSKNTWLFDITTLGEKAFKEGGLSSIFANNEICKIMYDGRGDCDALYHQFNCELVNVLDMQVMYVKCGCDAGRIKYLPGFAKVLQQVLPYYEIYEMNKIKEKGLNLFAPELGGSYDVWTTRPLNSELIEYAKSDVKHLLTIFNKFKTKINLAELRKISEKRINEIVKMRIPWPKGSKSKWTHINF